MLHDNTATIGWRIKTGWGFKENGSSIGWIVGWIEENNILISLC